MLKAIRLKALACASSLLSGRLSICQDRGRANSTISPLLPAPRGRHLTERRQNEGTRNETSDQTSA